MGSFFCYLLHVIDYLLHVNLTTKRWATDISHTARYILHVLLTYEYEINGIHTNCLQLLCI